MKSFLIVSILLLAVNSLLAQPGYKLELHESGAEYAYELSIAQVSFDHVVKKLEKRLEKGTRQEVIKEGPALFHIHQVAYKDYWVDSLSITVLIRSKQDSVRCYFSIRLDSLSVHEDSHPVLSKKIKKYINEFGLAMYEDAVEEELKREEKLYRSIEKEMKSAQKDQLKIEQHISNENLEIGNLKDAIAMNEGDRQHKITAIQAQKEVVGTTNGEQKSVEKEKLSTLKSELKHLQKSNKRMHKSVLKKKQKIQKLELELAQNEQLQTGIKDRLLAQGGVVNTVKGKQSAISDARLHLN